MLRRKNVKLVRQAATVFAAMVVLSLALAAYGQDNNEIDVGKISQSNPFVRFAGAQTPAPAAAAIAQESKPELFVETAILKFLDAKSLKASISNMSSAYGSIEPDGKSNSLIICDTNENLVKILEQIRKIDRKPDQIMIEVVLLDVKLDDETEIGVNWEMLTPGDHDAVFRQNLNFGTPAASSTTSTGIGSNLWLLWGNDIRNVIHVLQQKNNVEILASPRVMVVSGQTATIEAVEEIPYQEVTDTSQGGTAAMTSTQFKNVGVKLTVGATLTDDRFILLKVNTEQNVQTGTSVLVAATSGVPIVDTRKVESSLLLEDGQILVIGGLRRKETQKQTNQIPILGNLPIIGLAFKATDTVQNSSELLVILSPHIYKGERPTDAEREKYNEITQRPLLTIPEVVENKKEAEKEKTRQAQKAEKIEKAKEAKRAREAKKAKVAKRQ
jgi:protein transport protein HofQ